MALLPFLEWTPEVHPTAWVAPSATVIGRVKIGARVSIWPGCVIRGDVNTVEIEDDANIQDGAIIHVATFGQGTVIGARATLGHLALVHAATIHADGFVGMKACVLDGATVESWGMVAAGALVGPGKRVPTGELWGGMPARKLRDLAERDRDMIAWTARHYVELARLHRDGGTAADFERLKALLHAADAAG